MWFSSICHQYAICVKVPEDLKTLNFKWVAPVAGAPSTNFLKKRDFYFINVAKIGENGPKMEFFEFFEISYFFNVIVLKLF
jgi:hypothetical protein